MIYPLRYGTLTVRLRRGVHIRASASADSCARRRALGERQFRILNTLLSSDAADLWELTDLISAYYEDLKHPERALGRDLRDLLALEAITIGDDGAVAVNLDLPQRFAASELIERHGGMPSAAPFGHPAVADIARLIRRRGR